MVGKRNKYKFYFFVGICILPCYKGVLFCSIQQIVGKKHLLTLYVPGNSSSSLCLNKTSSSLFATREGCHLCYTPEVPQSLV